MKNEYAEYIDVEAVDAKDMHAHVTAVALLFRRSIDRASVEKMRGRPSYHCHAKLKETKLPDGVTRWELSATLSDNPADVVWVDDGGNTYHGLDKVTM